MVIAQVTTENQSNDAQDDVQPQEPSPICQELLSSLPKERGWTGPYLNLYQGFWCSERWLPAIISVQKHYKAEDSDLIVATFPKSGTTWLKALSFAIVNRQRFGHGQTHHHPLLTSNPHDLVPYLEIQVFANNQIPDLSVFPRPLLLGTHAPIGALPDSVRNSRCRLVYMARNPFDTFVSFWHFCVQYRPESLGPFPLEEAFDLYCRGVVPFGPSLDHALGYWNESLRNPHKVLFLKYEDLKENTGFHLKTLAEFLGFPFSSQEEEEGVVEGIAKLCSFAHMKELEVNKKGSAIAGFQNKNLFRKAEVGDWANHLTPSMVERLHDIMEQKLAGTGLSFKVS